ncbi:MAG: hypothetical protein U0871_12590 [Gemmataceae bacterium]
MPSARRVVAPLLFAAGASVTLLPVPPLAGQQKAGPPAVPKEYPALTGGPVSAKPGSVTRLSLAGTNLGTPTGVWTSAPGVALVVDGPKGPAGFLATLTLPPTTPVGLYALRAGTPVGVSNLHPLVVDELPQIAEAADNRSKGTPQPIPVPCVVAGRADAEAADYFRFPVSAGKPITLEVLGRRIGSPIDPVVILSDAAGRELGGAYADDTPGLQTDCRLTYTPKQDGELIAEVRDTTYRGGPDFHYRLRVGHFPGATTAFPLFVQRGMSAEVTFTGPDATGTEPVRVTMPADPAVLAVNVVPRRPGGLPGWPVPVRASDTPETLEQEPNDKPDQATILPVPGGVSARFQGKSDLDHFKFPTKKGQRYAAVALTAEVNSPAEVYLRVLGPDGKELGQSDPQKPTARVEFTAPADGDCVAVCEHLNYLSGPSEVYHLSVAPLAPDFAVTLGLGRADVPAGGVGLIPVTGLTKLNGFGEPITLTVAGDPDLSGTLTLPAGANPTPTAPAFVLVRASRGARPGPRAVHLTAAAGGKVRAGSLVRFASVADQVKAALAGIPTPPPELTTAMAVAVTPAAPFDLTVKADKPTVTAGGTLKLALGVGREAGFDEDVAFTAAAAPANVTVKAKPAGKGAATAEVEVAAAGNAAVGPGLLVLRGTAKRGGRDVSVLVPVELTVAAAKKEPEKKGKEKN